MLISISSAELKALKKTSETYNTEVLNKLELSTYDMFKLAVGGVVVRKNSKYTFTMSEATGLNLDINEEFVVDFLTVYTQNLSEVAGPILAMFKSMKQLVAMQPEQNKRFNDFLNKYKEEK